MSPMTEWPLRTIKLSTTVIRFDRLQENEHGREIEHESVPTNASASPRSGRLVKGSNGLPSTKAEVQVPEFRLRR